MLHGGLSAASFLWQCIWGIGHFLNPSNSSGYRLQVWQTAIEPEAAMTAVVMKYGEGLVASCSCWVWVWRTPTPSFRM